MTVGVVALARLSYAAEVLVSPPQPVAPAARPGHRPDRIGFRWESDMLPPLRDALPVVVGQRCLALLEVPAAAGVPDLVALVLDEPVVARRLAGGLAPVQDLTHARVLQALTAGIDDIDQLSRTAQVTAAHLRRSVLPALTAAGWLNTAANGASVVMHHPLEPIASLVVTVEAKKAAWQRAFKQALAHSASADRAFIAMDAMRATAVVEQRGVLRRMGVGVLTVDAVTGRVTVVARPRQTAPVPVQRTLLAERAWALHLAGETAGPSWPVFGRTLH